MMKKRILICPRVSKYEWDLHKYRCSHRELINMYRKEGFDYDRIFQSHERQIHSRKLVKRIFPDAMIIQKNNLTRENITNVDITISLGGDNHFQFVSHFIDDELIFGINSDYLESEGVLMSRTTKNIEDIKKRCDHDEFIVEKWTRLDVILNDEIVSRATCDVFIGELDRSSTSKNIIIYNDQSRYQKSSGILVSTGSGSTGWFSSASKYLIKNSIFDPKEKYAEFIVTEPYSGNLTDHDLLYGKVDNENTFKVNSLSSNGGIVISDSLEKFDFLRGSKVEIRISKNPLNVITFP